MTMDKGMRGFSDAALSLQRKTSENEDTGYDEKKKKVIRDVIKSKTSKGKDNFDPEPEIEEKDTMVKT